MASSRGNRAADILEQTAQHTKKVAALENGLRLAKEKLSRAENQIKN